MAAQKPRSAKQSVTRNTARDLGAQRAKEITEEQKKEAAEAAERMSVVRQQEEAEISEELVNLTDEEVTDEELAAVGAKTVATKKKAAPKTKKVAPATETIRLMDDVSFTLGAGNRYDFGAGKAYKVPYHVAQHLREKGLL